MLRRSGKNALSAARLSARRARAYELDRQVEQRMEALDDLVARHVLAIGGSRCQSVAEVGSESPVATAPICGSQRMRSLSSRPAYAVMPNGHAPGPWKCPSPSPARDELGPSLFLAPAGMRRLSNATHPDATHASAQSVTTESCEYLAAETWGRVGVPNTVWPNGADLRRNRPRVSAGAVNAGCLDADSNVSTWPRHR